MINKLTTNTKMQRKPRLKNHLDLLGNIRQPWSILRMLSSGNLLLQLFLMLFPVVHAQSLTSDASVIDAYLSGRCRAEQQIFELRSGLIQVSPGDTLATVPHSMHLSDCIARCARHAHCQSLNFETGLCVLFNRTEPTLLSAANFPVFTLHAQKRCLPSLPPGRVQCSSGWALETITGRRLRAPVARLAPSQRSSLDCASRCMEEKAFVCRAINFRSSDGRCELLRADRHALGDSAGSIDALQPDERWQHVQNACAPRPTGVCRFRKLKGRMLKTVDALFEHVTDEPSCRQLCLQSPNLCRSYTLGSSENRACRISHLSTYSASHIIDPWMQTLNADTYELTACYNVSVSCDSREMVAQVTTDRQFSGKLYAKGKPRTCLNDVKRGMEFELRLPYDDSNCEVQKLNGSRFSKDIVIQHHDLILTTKDIGLSLHCSYDLTNRTVQNSIRFEPESEGKEELEDRLVHSSFVYSPNVTIQIKDNNGLDVQTARVGDALTLRFVIDDENTPYEIFIHDLVASDGTPGNEIILIDSNGCPTEPAILGSIKRRQIRSDSAENQPDEQDLQWANGKDGQDITNLPSDVMLERHSQRPARLRIESRAESESEENSLTTLIAPTTFPTTILTSSLTSEIPSTIASSNRISTVQETTTVGTTTTIGKSKAETTRQTNPTSTVGIQSTNPATTPAPAITTATVITTTASSIASSSSSSGTTLRPAGKANPRQRPQTVTLEPPLRSKQLEATFEAFKFPTTNIVQFRAVVTPCLGECAPARCQLPTTDGGRRTAQSFGRRRRRSVAPQKIGRKTSEESLVVVQSIQINDKFDANSDSSKMTGGSKSGPKDFDNLMEEGWISCLTAGGLGLVVGILLFGQLAVIAVWLHVRGQWQQWRHRSWTPRHSKDVITTISDICRH